MTGTNPKGNLGSCFGMQQPELSCQEGQTELSLEFRASIQPFCTVVVLCGYQSQTLMY